MNGQRLRHREVKPLPRGHAARRCLSAQPLGRARGPERYPKGRGATSRSQCKDHTHPAQTRHSQGDTRLEVIGVLLAETGDEADCGRDHALRGRGVAGEGPGEGRTGDGVLPRG